MSRPLQGIRVLDLTRALAGPLCTSLLSDLGADVIKVESADGGDSSRGWPPFDGRHSLYFDSANRGKRSIALDSRTPEGRDILHQLAVDSDVIVENFRPGVLSRMGLDPDRLRATRPGLVIGSITGFGPVGPDRDSAGLDQIAQGVSGLMWVTGAGEHTPMRMGVPIVDCLAGVYLAVAINAALAGRAADGEGAHVQVSLFEAAVSVLGFQAQRYLSLGENPQAQGNNHPVMCPYGVFATKNGSINIAVGTEYHWQRLCMVLGAPDLAYRPEYADQSQRAARRDRLQQELEALLAARTSTEWVSAIQEAGIPCGPINSVAEMFNHPQARALRIVEQVTTGDGRAIPMLRGPLWLDGAPTSIRAAPPGLGQHTDAVLDALGYRAEHVASLREKGIVA